MRGTQKWRVPCCGEWRVDLRVESRDYLEIESSARAVRERPDVGSYTRSRTRSVVGMCPYCASRDVRSCERIRDSSSLGPDPCSLVRSHVTLLHAVGCLSISRISPSGLLRPVLEALAMGAAWACECMQAEIGNGKAGLEGGKVSIGHALKIFELDIGRNV